MKSFLKYWLPLLVWLVVIFVGSTNLMSAEHTSRFIVPFLLWLKPGMTQENTWWIIVLMRNCAHVGEYVVLALLMWRALRWWRKQPCEMARPSAAGSSRIAGATTMAGPVWLERRKSA